MKNFSCYCYEFVANSAAKKETFSLKDIQPVEGLDRV